MITRLPRNKYLVTMNCPRWGNKFEEVSLVAKSLCEANKMEADNAFRVAVAYDEFVKYKAAQLADVKAYLAKRAARATSDQLSFDF